MRKLYFLILLAFAISSCTNYKVINIEVLSPAKYSFPKGTQNIVLLNNANEQAPNIGHYSYKQDIGSIYSNKREKISNDNVKVDNTTTIALRSMSNMLNSLNIFSSVNIAQIKDSPRIDYENINNYFQEYNSDVIVVLEDVSYIDEYTQYYYSYYSSSEYELKVKSNVHWKIYSKNRYIIPYEYIQQDTAYWTSTSINRPECIQEAIWNNTTKAAQQIIPYWVTVNRLYYTSSGYIYNNIDNLANANKWEEAATLWMQIYQGEKKNSTKKGRMAYNMALYFELKNDMLSAMEWLNTAKDIFKNKKNAEEELSICNTYYEILSRRAKTQELLNRQLTL